MLARCPTTSDRARPTQRTRSCRATRPGPGARPAAPHRAADVQSCARALGLHGRDPRWSSPEHPVDRDRRPERRDRAAGALRARRAEGDPGGDLRRARSELEHGDLIVVSGALVEDGTSRRLGAGALAEPDGGLTAALAGALTNGGEPSRVVTTDLFYDGDSRDGAPGGGLTSSWRERGAVAVEMEAATLFTLGRSLGVATACVLAVSDLFVDGERRRIGDEDLAAAAERLGTVAAAALEAQA